MLFVKEKKYEIALEVVYGLATIESVYHYAMDNLTGTNIPDIIFCLWGMKKSKGIIRACYEKRNLDS